MPTSIPMSPRTSRALRTLLGRSLARLFERPDPRVLRELRADARRLVVTSPDGVPYSGVLVLEANEVTTGLVVPALRESVTDSENAPVLCESAESICETGRVLSQSPRPTSIEPTIPGDSEATP